MTRLGTLALTVTALTVGCTGTDVGNPVVDVQLLVHDRMAGGDTLTGAWIVYDELRVLANCQEVDQVAPGPFVVDLVAGETPDQLRNLPLDGEYCSLTLPYAVAAEPSPGLPAELEGASLVLEGTRADDTPFLLRLDRLDDALTLFAADGRPFPLGPDTGTAFIAFDASVWLDALDLDVAVVEDGEIRIETGSNDDLLTELDRVVDSAAHLFDDDDGDGELDQSERDEAGDVLASGS